MSSDDGYLLRQNKEGKYVLQHYFMSADEYPPIEGAQASQIYDTLEDAVYNYQKQDSDDFRSEYGLTVNVWPPKTERGTMQTARYTRKTFAVDAVQVDDTNMEEVAAWCGGNILEEDGRKYIKVEVTGRQPIDERQTQAFVGDWVLKAAQGFKVYLQRAFANSFELSETKNNVFVQQNFHTDHGGGGSGSAPGGTGFPHVNE